MDLAADLPVTLVVKAANQRVADQTVECVLGWTIRKLKQHLESVYPSKPKHHQQKLIYSGQLLADHLTLKEVLRQYDQNSQHTVHLVCSPSVDSLSQPGPSQSLSTEKKSEPHTSTPQSYISPSSGPDGLRHRGAQQPNVSPSHSEVTNAGGSQAATVAGGPVMEGMAGMSGVGGVPLMPAGGPGMMGMPGYGYTPEQIAWMQQMYSQYMAQYMQYYGYQVPAPAQPANPVQAPAPQPAANPAPANNAAPNPNMRMNAQGGMEEDDDEEHRDWLDYIYVCFRFLVLVSIVYFYSSASRFFTVALGFFAVYMLQNGWWIWNRRQQQQQQQQQQEAQQPPAQPQQQQQQQQQQQPEQQQPPNLAEGQNEAGAEERREEEGAATAPPEDIPPAVDAQQEAPSTPVVLLRMLVSFFTSLVPAPPPAVNGN